MTPPDWLVDLIKTPAGLTGFWVAFFGFGTVIVALCLYRREIAGFIGRTRKIGAGKWGAEAQEQNPDQKIPAPATGSLIQGGERTNGPRNAADELIAQLSVNPYVKQREDLLKKTLAERGLDVGSPETYRVLTAYMASAFVAAAFEQLYNVIWTTQLQIVNEANARESLTEEEMRRFYNLGASASPAIYSKYAFEAYLRFLTAQELLTQTADGKYAITVKGRTFLMYLIHEGRQLTGRIY